MSNRVLWPSRRRQILGLLARERWRLAAVLVLTVIISGSGLAGPILLQLLIDGPLTPPYEPRTLLPIGAAVLGLGVLRFLAEFGQTYFLARASTQSLLQVRTGFFRHVLQLPLSFHEKSRFGEVSTRMGQDIIEIRNAVTGAFLGLLGAVITTLGTVSLLLYYDVRLFLASFAAWPAAYFVTQRFKRRLTRLTRSVQEALERYATYVADCLIGIKAIRAAGRDRRELRKLIQLQIVTAKQVVNLSIVRGLARGSTRLIGGVSQLIAVFLGAYFVMRGEMTKGELLAFAFALNRVFSPLDSVAGLYLQIQKALVSADRLFEVMELPIASTEVAGRPLRPVRGRIEFDSVCFGWEPERPVLRGVSVCFSPGARAAIVGRSGSGKSTLVSLLFRLADPDEGRVLVDGVDISTVTAQSLRRQMAWVSQDAHIRHGSLLENIREAHPKVQEPVLRRVIEATGLDALASRLPDGLETELGNRGFRLSGGEKQRVSLARAILARPRILVLDEATAHLDLEADRRIDQALRTLEPFPTTLTVTHRATGLDEYDQVVVLDLGRVVADGAPSSVLLSPEAKRVLHGLEVRPTDRGTPES